jgi:hypothetical protein
MTGSALAVLVASLAIALAGCSTGSGGGTTTTDGGADVVVPGCALGFLGTPGKPVEMKVTARGAAMTPADEVADGGRVPLILPPQGGRVIFVGIEATNLSACGVTLTGSLRDTANKQVRVDARTTNLLPRGDGWGTSDAEDISTFSNIPLCPNEWASTDAFEQPFELTLDVKDPAGNHGTTKMTIVPFCGEPQYMAECLCTCKKGYVLGQACNDAGP